VQKLSPVLDRSRLWVVVISELVERARPADSWN